MSLARLHEKVSAEDSILELGIQVGDDTAHQGTGAVVDDEADQFIGLDDALVLGDGLETHKSPADIMYLDLVDNLSGIAVVLVQDLVDVGVVPAAVLVEILGQAVAEPLLGAGHVEVVGQDEGLGEVGDEGGGAAKTNARAGAARLQDEVETLEVLDLDVGDTEHAGLGLLPGAVEESAEVGGVVAEELLGDLDAGHGDGFAVDDILGAQDLDLGSGIHEINC